MADKEKKLVLNLEFEQNNLKPVSLPLNVTIELHEGDNELQIPVHSNLTLLDGFEAYFNITITLEPGSELLAIYDIVRLCSAEFLSERSPRLTIKTAETQRDIYFEKPDSTNSDEFGQSISEFLQSATQTIISALENEQVNVLVRKPLPELPQEMLDSLQTVYRDGCFYGLYDPDIKYDESFKILPLKSTYGGTGTLNQGQNFANVIGSSGDKRINGKSWIELWKYYFTDPTNCSSLNYKGFHCSGPLYGGHCILGQKAQAKNYGVNQTVFIIPICKDHNEDDNVYMSPIKYRGIVWLDNYHNP